MLFRSVTIASDSCLNKGKNLVSLGVKRLKNEFTIPVFVVLFSTAKLYIKFNLQVSQLSFIQLSFQQYIFVTQL